MTSDSKTPRHRWIPINDIPLHDRPSREALLDTVKSLENLTSAPGTWNSEHLGRLEDVQGWLRRVANIPEDPK